LAHHLAFARCSARRFYTGSRPGCSRRYSAFGKPIYLQTGRRSLTRSDILTVSPAARKIAEQIFSGRATKLRVPKWYLALTTHLRPDRLRGEYGLIFGEREQRSMNLALALIRRLYPRLPIRIRAVGPYQEALARLQGERQPDLAVRWLNRLWIGRAMME
jgi:hypothetical protein